MEFHPITPKAWRLLYTKAATRKFGQRLHKNPLINFSIAVGLKSIHSRFLGIDRNLPKSSIRLITEQKLTVKFTHVHFLSIIKFDANIRE